MPEKLYLSIFIDCESTQPAVNDPALGERASRGFAEVMEAYGLRGTFHVIPTDMDVHADMYRELKQRGHEVGLHIHPAVQGYQEFLGVYGPDDQRKIIDEAADRFAQGMGERPDEICVGYFSINDHTFGMLYELGFRHGSNTMPNRALPQCASVHAGAPLDVHYTHRYNRTLAGDLDLVEIPVTIDPESRLWGGLQPQDLRVELVDAKNHWYTIDKAVKRQLRDQVPVKVIRGLTHNTFEFSQTGDFRRETLEGIIKHTFAIADQHELSCTAGTGREIAATYRAAVPLGSVSGNLELDRRGHGEKTK